MDRSPKERELAFESEKKGAADGGELGELAAELPSAERNEDADDAVDAAALAALSKGQPSQRPVGADDAARVQLAGASALVTDHSSSRPPPPSTTTMRASQPSAARFVVPLLIGFAIGVPTGGFFFSDRAAAPEAAPAPIAAPIEPQPSAAEARARAADEIAARVHPLPGVPARAAPAAPAADSPQAAVAEPVAEAAPADPAPAPAPRPAVVKAPAPAASAKRQDPAAVTPAPAPSPQAAAAPPVEAPPPVETAVPAAPGMPDPRSVDQLLDDALTKREQAQQRALAPAETMPLAPTREDVTRAMTVLLPAIRGCAAGQSGLATLGIVVRNDGRVESVTVSGAPFEGARSGRCMEGVVRKAKFPRFQQSSFRVQFPFAIQ